MTEAEWLACADPKLMLQFLEGRASARKLSLFSCACSRRIWDLITDERRRRAVESAERFADGLASVTARPNDVSAAIASAGSTADIVRDTDRREAARAFMADYRAKFGKNPPPHDMPKPDAGPNPELTQQAELLREIIGNPFQPPSGPTTYPMVLKEMAERMYTGDAVRLNLQAMLRNSGYDQLAQHLKEPYHPKGCWVLDLIMGKK